MITVLSVLFFLVCLLLCLYSFVHSTKEDMAKRDKEFLDGIRRKALNRYPTERTFSKKEFGRCVNAVGRFGFDVSNPICIKSIYDACFDKYLYDMVIDGKGISGYIVVSMCRCSLFGEKPIYRVGVRREDKKSFVTLYFLEDGVTQPKYFPSGIVDKSFLYYQDLINNGGHVNFKESFFQHRSLLKKEDSQKAMPKSLEKVYKFQPPKKQEGEDNNHFASRLQAYKTRKMLSDDYWKFANRENCDALLQKQRETATRCQSSTIPKSEYEADDIVKKYNGRDD